MTQAARSVLAVCLLLFNGAADAINVDCDNNPDTEDGQVFVVSAKGRGELNLFHAAPCDRSEASLSGRKSELWSRQRTIAMRCEWRSANDELHLIRVLFSSAGGGPPPFVA
jgi:hypothetical protein